VRKGEIWLVKLQDRTGHEQQGTRPGLIVGKSNGLVTIIPLTKNILRDNLAFTKIIDCSPDNGLTQDSVALIFQIITLDESKLIQQKGQIKKELYEEVHDELIRMTKIN
jgi:mRNA interferase MazF